MPVLIPLSLLQSAIARSMGRPHKRITDWARQMILQLRRWLPDRPIVVVADSSYAALDLLTLLPVHGSARHPHHQVETGRRALRTRSKTTARSDGTSAPEGPATAHAQRTPQPPRYALEPDVGRMVQQRYPYGGTQLSHRALVSQRQAACAHSLGSHSRSTQAVPLPGSAVHRSFSIPHADP